jgi:hypothetical protein
LSPPIHLSRMHKKMRHYQLCKIQSQIINR